MVKSISLCIHLAILGAFICFTTAVSLRHKRNVIAEYKWPEPDPNTDHFAHESSCHHYYLVLSEEDITVHKCPHGELFDYVEHKCKDKETARCWVRHFGRKKHHHIPLKSMGPFTCPYAWGKYPDINDCTKYFTCLGGKVKHKKCAPFEHFDKVSRKCVAAISGVCADKTDVVEHDFKCPKNWGSFPFHKDCSKYYECLDKQPNLRTCPIDALFHEKKGKCVSKSHVHCRSRHNPYIKKDLTSNTLTKTSPSENLPTTSNDSGKSSIESKTTLSVIKTSLKAEITREVQSGDRVSQTTQSSKEPTIVEITNSVSNSTPTVPSIESEPKSDVNMSSEPGKSTDGKPFVVKDLETSQTPKQLTTSDTYMRENNSIAKPDFIDSTLKKPDSNETGSEVEHNTFNDTDEIPDSLNTSEFIEVSTDSQSSMSTASQTPAVESSPKIEKDSTDDKKDHQTTLELNQATSSEECSPKDYTCITEEGGRILRCPAPDGIFPYPGDERRFLICIKQEIHVKFCRGHLIFSPAAKECISKMIF